MESDAKYTVQSLFQLGFRNWKDFKYSIVDFALETAFRTLILYLINEVVISSDTELDAMAVTAMLVLVMKVVMEMCYMLLHPYVLDERIRLADRVTTEVDRKFSRANNSWKEKYTNEDQKRSLIDVHKNFVGITISFSKWIVGICSWIGIIVVVTLQIDLLITIAIVVCVFIVFRISVILKKEADDSSAHLVEKVEKHELDIDNQFSQRTNVNHYNTTFSSLIGRENTNPVMGLSELSRVWEIDGLLLAKVGNKIRMIESGMICSMLFYLYYVGNRTAFLFVMMNQSRIFEVIEVVTNMQTEIMHTKDRLSKCIEMLNDLPHESLYSTHLSPTDVNDCELVIESIERRFGINKIMRYKGNPIQIDLSKRGVILLDGKEGCGKSLTFNTLAGFYDDKMACVVKLGNNYLENGFRDLIGKYVYIWQDIMGTFSNNAKNTVTLSAQDLFPNGTYHTIKNFLIPYRLHDKLPTDLTKAFTANEDGEINEMALSFGQKQALLIASQIWFTKQINNIKMLFLDEPERNISLETIKSIIDSILDEDFNGTIFLVTHSEELKTYLATNHHLKQKWQFRDPLNNVHSFTVQTY